MTCEEFRDFDVHNKKPIRVTYENGNGDKVVWVQDQSQLYEKIDGIIDKYQEINIKLTSRQLYYQLVGEDFIPNADKIYKRICTFATDLRYGGWIDWDALEDRGRQTSKHAEWNSINGVINAAIRLFRLPRWDGQVSWELDAIEPTELQTIAEESIIQYLDMPLYNQMLDEENAEKQALIEFGNNYK